MAVARRMIYGAVFAVVAMEVGLASPSGAGPTSAIGPNQHYLGYVNGKHSQAVIHVACPGPAGGHRTGPPVGRQTVNLKRVSSGGGYTGSLAHQRIWAQFGRDALHVVGFTSYNTPKAIPNGLRLPCDGTGTVTFTTCFGTLPCSSSAKDDTVRVTFENIAV